MTCFLGMYTEIFIRVLKGIGLALLSLMLM